MVLILCPSANRADHRISPFSNVILDLADRQSSNGSISAASRLYRWSGEEEKLLRLYAQLLPVAA